MNYAILLSGGKGTRAGGSLPKQYSIAGGFMMISYSLKTLLISDETDRIIIVAEEEWQEKIREESKRLGVDTVKLCAFAKPGRNRQESIYNGIKEIIRSAGESAEISDFTEEDTVLVHDAARPFLSLKLLKDCYDSLGSHDGVMPVLAMKDTVYYSEDGKSVSSLLEREKLYAGQAPELFRLVNYAKANEALMPEKILEINGATETAIRYGMKIKMIAGDEKNFKVTTASDMDRFQDLFGGK